MLKFDINQPLSKKDIEHARRRVTMPATVGAVVTVLSVLVLDHYLRRFGWWRLAPEAMFMVGGLLGSQRLERLIYKDWVRLVDDANWFSVSAGAPPDVRTYCDQVQAQGRSLITFEAEFLDRKVKKG